MSSEQVQMRPEIFYFIHPFSIILFLLAFKMACVNSDIHEQGAFGSSRTSFNSCQGQHRRLFVIKEKPFHSSLKEGVLTTYYCMFNHLHNTYFTEYIIEEVDREIDRYTSL